MAIPSHPKVTAMAISHSAPQNTSYRGDNKALAGFILGLLTFWLFAQTLLNVGPDVAEDIGMSASTMTLAISLSALFSGMLIVTWGGLADNFGRLRIFTIGAVLAVIGSLLLVAAAGPLASPLFLAGRVIQGLSIGAIMPASMALVGAYWEGEDRQKASSMWAFGTFGGSGLASIVGGVIANSIFGWRSIFILSALFAVGAILLTRHIPESRAPRDDAKLHLDYVGMITLAVTLLALQLVISKGAIWGWTSLAILSLVAVTLVFFIAFIWAETRQHRPLVRLAVFKNMRFSAATLSNFLVNLSVGMIPLTMWTLNKGHGMAASTAGYLTLAYPVVLIFMLGASVKILNKIGPKWTMALGPASLVFALLLLSLTHLPLNTYTVAVVIAFGVFGAGLALYATPSINMALSELPEDIAGAGAGIYKMASSLGGAIGVAVSGSVFNAIYDGVDPDTALSGGQFGLWVNTIFMGVALATILLLLPNKTPQKA
ncbi:Quinolone resistance protein NorB [Corynebacterium guangdongense]|nr:Quinolone resistance protein NorB [Corynebacterium guangdongense]